MTGVSVVIPVHNGEAWIRECVASVLAQLRDRPGEILLVDDGSTDGSSPLLQELATQSPVRVLPGPGRGAAAAINAGIRAARFPLIAQIDQDVVLGPGWFDRLVAELDAPSVAAAQGYYVSAPDARLFGRVMNLDLEQRYAGIRGAETDHVCTGNAIYRAEPLNRVGLFDESLGYGYDNDISYRLCAAGYTLRINREARAVHRWREGVVNYLKQQYGFGYGRIDLVAKYPHRVRGDAVSPFAMMLHPIVMTMAMACAVVGGIAVWSGRSPSSWWMAAAGLGFALVIERLVVGISTARRFGDAAALAFPVVHLLRDVAWVAAIGRWSWRRLARQPCRPSDSMTPRPAYRVNRADSSPAPKRPRA